MDISDYIKQLQSVEEYAFSWDELVKKCHKTETALKRELSRLVTKKEIVNLRKGFYLIIPPRYSKQEQIPVQLFSNKLFQYLKRDYYLSFEGNDTVYSQLKLDYKKPFEITEDCFGNIHLICQDSVRQFWINNQIQCLLDGKY